MKNIKSYLYIAFFSGLLVFFASCEKKESSDTKKSGSSAESKPEYEWTFQSSDQVGEFTVAIQQAWADDIYKASNGRIKINVVSAGSIVEYNQTLNSIGSGIIQGDFTDPSYFTGQDPAFSLYGNLIGAWETPWDLVSFMYYGGGFEVVNELLNSYGVELLAVSTTGTEAFVSKKPLRNIKDLKGVKLRAPEGMVQNLFSNLGASPVNLPGSEVYTALEKGVIDAADYTVFSRNQAIGLNDIAKYPIYPGWHSTPTLQVTMNKKIYDSLSDDLKMILKISGKSFGGQFLIEHQKVDNEAVRKARAAGANIISWSPEEIAKVREVARSLWSGVAQQSPMAKKYYDVVTNYLKKQGKLK